MDRLAISGILIEYGITEKQAFKLFRLNGKPLTIEGKVKLVTYSDRIIKFSLDTDDKWIEEHIAKSKYESECHEYLSAFMKEVKITKDNADLTNDETVLYKYLLDATGMRGEMKKFIDKHEEGTMFHIKGNNLLSAVDAVINFITKKINDICDAKRKK